MKSFLFKFGVFSGGLLLYMAAVYGINSLVIQNNKLIVKENILIVGDSYMQRALNPQHFFSAKNISQPAEPYYVSFWKLKEVLNSNKIDTVLIGFSHHNISTFNDKKLIDPSWSGEMFNRIYALEEVEGIKGLEVDDEKLKKTWAKNLLLFPKLNHENYIGSYTNSKKSEPSDVDNAVQRHFYYKKKPAEISTTAVTYLKKMITLCKDNNTKVILISNPVTEAYFKAIPEKFHAGFDALADELKNNGVTILNHTNTKFENVEFLNSDHLNDLGATKFSIKIQNELSNQYLNALGATISN